jgi:type II secretory pathway pseudopilin PulG
MVVIVIIGILAAIAIPKLFGMTAKAKAQEVGPAAGTWIKLEQAFMAEIGKLGPNNRIGYTLPGVANSNNKDSETGNFKYVTSLALADSPSDETKDNAKAQFKATGKALGDCASAGIWTVDMDTDNELTAAIAGGENCEILTPNFAKLGNPVTQ